MGRVLVLPPFCFFFFFGNERALGRRFQKRHRGYKKWRLLLYLLPARWGTDDDDDDEYLRGGVGIKALFDLGQKQHCVREE